MWLTYGETDGHLLLKSNFATKKKHDVVKSLLKGLNMWPVQGE